MTPIWPITSAASSVPATPPSLKGPILMAPTAVAGDQAAKIASSGAGGQYQRSASAATPAQARAAGIADGGEPSLDCRLARADDLAARPVVNS